MDTRELREKRATLVAQARALLDKETIAPEDSVAFDKAMADADAIKARIDREERVGAAEAALDTRLETRAGRERISKDEALAKVEAENEAFDLFLRWGMAALSPEQRGIMAARAVHGIDAPPAIRAALGTGSPGTAGGYTIAQEFQRELDEALKAFGGIREACRVVRTATGAAMPWPTVNDSGTKGARIAENTQVTEADPTFGAVILNAYLYTSKLVRVPYTLLQDSAFNLNQFLAEALATRIGRIVNEECTTGDGSDKPNGIVTASTLGHTGDSGTGIETDDFITLEHSVDPAYRRGASWMFADSTLRAAKMLKDDQGRFIWLPGLATNAPDTILGYPFTINQDMAPMGLSAKSVLFGQMQKYILRETLGVQLLRLEERYADYLQVGFLAFARYDGDLIDAGTHPVKHFANAAA